MSTLAAVPDAQLPLGRAREWEMGTLLCSVFIVSACTIVYELLISTFSSYFLGSSVLHFSATIGLFMSFLGVGSLLSKFITRNLLEWFISIEIALGVVGGLSAYILHLAFSLTEYYYLTAFLLTAVLATLAGLEIPLITRIIRDYQPLKDALAHILSFDYLGALFSSLLFPLVLLPYLGIVRTALVVGILNIAVAIILLRVFNERLKSYRLSALSCGVGVIVLLAGLALADRAGSLLEQFLYDDEIVVSTQSSYQKIVLTTYRGDTRLFLNGDLQFSSVDEYRYHEALVHIPLHLARYRDTVLVLGGGDGLALREILKYPDVKNVTVVDIDPGVTSLASSHQLLTSLNQRSLQDPRVTVVNADAWNYLESMPQLFSIIVSDLPDPDDFALGKLYSREFYAIIRKRLAKDGIFVSQASSPYFARKAFWSIHDTLHGVFGAALPYTVNVPSFGQWGFVMASSRVLEKYEGPILVPTRYLSRELLPSFFHFDSDTAHTMVEQNRLDNQVLVRYYEEEWRRFQPGEISHHSSQ